MGAPPWRVAAAMLGAGLIAAAALGCSGAPAARSPSARTAASTGAATPPSSAAGGTVAVAEAVFASPTGAFLCSLDRGVVDCLWPASTRGIAVPTGVCPAQVAVEGPELRAARAPSWLCGTDVGVVPTADTVSWAPPGTPTAPGAAGVATPELGAGRTLTSGDTRCRGVGRGVRCSASGGWFYLAPGHFSSGSR